MYVLTFPTSWQTNFDVQKDIDNTSFNEIDNYMRKQKDGADRKKTQKDKDKKKNDKKKPNKKGSKKDKYKLDPKATGGPTARCTKCPNAKHSWGHCFFNPRNPKNKLEDAEFMSRQATNHNRNNGNQYQNNQQPRQGFATQQMPPPPPPPNYQGVYSNQSQNQGPPSSVSVQSGQSYSNDQGGGRWSQVWIPN